MNKLQEKRDKLSEYADLLGEYGDDGLAVACDCLVNMAENACCLSPEFEQLINVQVDIQLQYFEDNITVEEDVEIIKRPFKRLIWNEKEGG